MQLTPGTRAFVTGASRGIGRALAGALAVRGVTLGLAARSTDELAALAAELPGEHQVLECDVADAASTQAAIDGFARAPAASSCSSPTPASPTTARSATSRSTRRCR
jgi:NADP-dependent 3-hydroxy acid dehydrogenase YdfG